MNKIEIKTNYTLLHFDEYPILFIGKNAHVGIVIGSFLFETDDDNFTYFHSVITQDVASKFLNRSISYLEVLKNANAIFIVKKDINDKILSKKEVKFDKIDKAILPLPSAFCPDIDKKMVLPFEENNTTIVSNKRLDKVDNLYSVPTLAFKNI